LKADGDAVVEGNYYVNCRPNSATVVISPNRIGSAMILTCLTWNNVNVLRSLQLLDTINKVAIRS